MVYEFKKNARSANNQIVTIKIKYVQEPAETSPLEDVMIDQRS